MTGGLDFSTLGWSLNYFFNYGYFIFSQIIGELF